MNDYPRTIDTGAGEKLTFHYVLSRYRSEFGMADIPAPVQRFVFPVVVAVGRLLGRDRRFAGAPEPIRRTRPSAGTRP
jgi:hypothetical protein